VSTESDEYVLDLDAERAARREAAAKPVRLRLGGRTFDLPAELPIDVLQPLENLDIDLAMLIRQAVTLAQGQSDPAAATALVVDLLVANPNLPKSLIDAVRQMGQRLLGEEAYAALVASRPSYHDVAAVAKYLFKSYGVSLGNASGSNGSSETAGATSPVTSNGSTDSTPGSSSPALTAPASSGSADS
jgi:hypothetical protein